MFIRVDIVFALICPLVILLGCGSAEPPVKMEEAANLKSVPAIPYRVVSQGADGSQTVEYQVTQYTTETRTRTIPVQRVQTETRVRTVSGDDGSTREETYAVEVPYTETVEESYSVQVPVSQTRTVVIPAGQEIEEFLAAEAGNQ